MMSGGPIDRFTKGWAVRLKFGSHPAKAHYFVRDEISWADALCGIGSIKAAGLREAGSFQRCKRCEKKLSLVNKGCDDAGTGQHRQPSRVAEKLREQEAPYKVAGDWRGLGIGAMALAVEQAIEELEYLRPFAPSPDPFER